MKEITVGKFVVSLLVIITISFSLSLLTAPTIVTGASAAGTTTVSVGVSTTISLPTSTVAFGSLDVNEYNDTVDDDPPPFTLQNDGSVDVNITVQATTIWNSSMGGNDTVYYRYNISESEDGTLFNVTEDVINSSWPFFRTDAVTAVTRVNFSNNNDLLEIDINITVPGDESQGDKSSSVTFTASQA